MLFKKIVIKNDLERTVYEFGITDQLKLRLYSFSIEKRQTTRHHFKKVDYYESISPRDSTIKRDQITIPDDIVKDVIGQILNFITLSNL